jgi:two-component system sensor histidine kinase HydH
MLDMSNNFQNPAKTKFRPLLWIMAGCILILLPIIIYWTHDNISRQERAIELLLTQKAEGIINNLEIGVRFRMMRPTEFQFPGQGWYDQGYNQDPLQASVNFFSRINQDVSYIILTDLDGNITNHTDPEQIGKNYGHNIDYPSLINFGGLNKLETRDKDGNNIFEVYRVFLPKLAPGSSQGGRRNPQNRDRRFQRQRFPGFPEEGTRIIFVGLDMTYIEAQSKEDTREIFKRGFYLLLIGFAGISLLILVQAYRSAQTSLSRIKALSDNIVDNMPIGLIVLDIDSDIASFNNTAETLLHISGENIIGKPVEEKLPVQFIELINELKHNKRNIVKEIELDLEEHGKVYLDINLSALEDSSGILQGYIILFRDLSEVQALKKEVERSTRLASIGRLAAGVAHEIRNPLSSIKGFATYFGERYKDIPEDKNTAQIMVNEVERLNRVISQLLEFARPVNINRKPLDIKTVINHSVKIIERNAGEKDIRVRVDVPSGIPHINVDSDRINQVFINLFLNSIEAMGSGGELSVRVDYDSAAEMMKIKVSDTGKGIAPKDLGNVFDPYFTTKQSGTGLGLAIVHRIIESHNGEIKVKSIPGKRTDVTITLPLD